MNELKVQAMVQAAYARGFSDGFAISGEGWNAEYPFNHHEKTDYEQDGHYLTKLGQGLMARTKVLMGRG